MGRKRRTATRQPRLDSSCAHSGLVGDLIHRHVAQVVEDEGSPLFGRDFAQGIAECDSIRGGLCHAPRTFGQQTKTGATTGAPPSRGRDAPSRDADPSLRRLIPVDLVPAGPSAHERLLDGILSFRFVTDHGVELPHEPLEAGCVEPGELVPLHGVSIFPGIWPSVFRQSVLLPTGAASGCTQYVLPE